MEEVEFIQFSTPNTKLAINRSITNTHIGNKSRRLCPSSSIGNTEGSKEASDPLTTVVRNAPIIDGTIAMRANSCT